MKIMFRRTITLLLATVLLLIVSPVLFRKRTVPLASRVDVADYATRPFVGWGDNEFGIYQGGTNVFSLWGDQFHTPNLVYVFPDGQRFFCMDWDDTANLVFVVDLNRTRTNAVGAPPWPEDDYARNYLATRAPDILIKTNGVVRLPTRAELGEVSGYIAALTPGELKTVSFPFWDLGLFRDYLPKEFLLERLGSNRKSVW